MSTPANHTMATTSTDQHRPNSSPNEVLGRLNTHAAAMSDSDLSEPEDLTLMLQETIAEVEAEKAAALAKTSVASVSDLASATAGISSLLRTIKKKNGEYYSDDDDISDDASSMTVSPPIVKNTTVKGKFDSDSDEEAGSSTRVSRLDTKHLKSRRDKSDKKEKKSKKEKKEKKDKKNKKEKKEKKDKKEKKEKRQSSANTMNDSEHAFATASDSSDDFSSHTSSDESETFHSDEDNTSRPKPRSSTSKSKLSTSSKSSKSSKETASRLTVPKEEIIMRKRLEKLAALERKRALVVENAMKRETERRQRREEKEEARAKAFVTESELPQFSLPSVTTARALKTVKTAAVGAMGSLLRKLVSQSTSLDHAIPTREAPQSSTDARFSVSSFLKPKTKSKTGDLNATREKKTKTVRKKVLRKTLRPEFESLRPRYTDLLLAEVKFAAMCSSSKPLSKEDVSSSSAPVKTSTYDDTSLLGQRLAASRLRENQKFIEEQKQKEIDKLKQKLAALSEAKKEKSKNIEISESHDSDIELLDSDLEIELDSEESTDSSDESNSSGSDSDIIIASDVIASKTTDRTGDKMTDKTMGKSVTAITIPDEMTTIDTFIVHLSNGSTTSLAELRRTFSDHMFMMETVTTDGETTDSEDSGDEIGTLDDDEAAVDGEEYATQSHDEEDEFSDIDDDDDIEEALLRRQLRRSNSSDSDEEDDEVSEKSGESEKEEMGEKDQDDIFAPTIVSPFSSQAATLAIPAFDTSQEKEVIDEIEGRIGRTGEIEIMPWDNLFDKSLDKPSDKPSDNPSTTFVSTFGSLSSVSFDPVVKPFFKVGSTVATLDAFAEVSAPSFAPKSAFSSSSFALTIDDDDDGPISTANIIKPKSALDELSSITDLVDDNGRTSSVAKKNLDSDFNSSSDREEKVDGDVESESESELESESESEPEVNVEELNRRIFDAQIEEDKRLILERKNRKLRQKAFDHDEDDEGDEDDENKNGKVGIGKNIDGDVEVNNEDRQNLSRSRLNRRDYVEDEAIESDEEERYGLFGRSRARARDDDGDEEEEMSAEELEKLRSFIDFAGPTETGRTTSAVSAFNTYENDDEELEALKQKFVYKHEAARAAHKEWLEQQRRVRLLQQQANDRLDWYGDLQDEQQRLSLAVKAMELLTGRPLTVNERKIVEADEARRMKTRESVVGQTYARGGVLSSSDDDDDDDDDNDDGNTNDENRKDGQSEKKQIDKSKRRKSALSTALTSMGIMTSKKLRMARKATRRAAKKARIEAKQAAKARKQEEKEARAKTRARARRRAQQLGNTNADSGGHRPRARILVLQDEEDEEEMSRALDGCDSDFSEQDLSECSSDISSDSSDDDTSESESELLAQEIDVEGIFAPDADENPEEHARYMRKIEKKMQLLHAHELKLHIEHGMVDSSTSFESSVASGIHSGGTITGTMGTGLGTNIQRTSSGGGNVSLASSLSRSLSYSTHLSSFPRKTGGLYRSASTSLSTSSALSSAPTLASATAANTTDLGSFEGLGGGRMATATISAPTGLPPKANRSSGTSKSGNSLANPNATTLPLESSNSARTKTGLSSSYSSLGMGLGRTNSLSLSGLGASATSTSASASARDSTMTHKPTVYSSSILKNISAGDLDRTFSLVAGANNSSSSSSSVANPKKSFVFSRDGRVNDITAPLGVGFSLNFDGYFDSTASDASSGVSAQGTTTTSLSSAMSSLKRSKSTSVKDSQDSSLEIRKGVSTSNSISNPISNPLKRARTAMLSMAHKANTSNDSKAMGAKTLEEGLSQSPSQSSSQLSSQPKPADSLRTALSFLQKK